MYKRKGNLDLLRNKRNEEMQGTEQVWIEEEGGFKVVKIADSLSSSLKHEVCDSFVATVSHLDVTACDIKEWLLSKEGFKRR